MGLSRFELLTPRLSSVCSNQLSYRPVFVCLRHPASNQGNRRSYSSRFSKRPTCLQTTNLSKSQGPPLVPSKLDRAFTTSLLNTRSIIEFLLPTSSLPSTSSARVSRKEVIQPQVLLQLPCYDFTPITDHTLGTCLPCGLAGLLLVQPAFVM